MRVSYIICELLYNSKTCNCNYKRCELQYKTYEYDRFCTSGSGSQKWTVIKTTFNFFIFSMIYHVVLFQTSSFPGYR